VADNDPEGEVYGLSVGRPRRGTNGGLPRGSSSAFRRRRRDLRSGCRKNWEPTAGERLAFLIERATDTGILEVGREFA
jgi:hypothetical protein